MIVSEPTVRLAGRLGGLRYSDRGRVSLKGIPDPIHIYQVQSELDARPTNRWVLMILGKPARALGWKLGVGVVALAAITAASVVYLTSGDHGEQGTAAPPGETLPSVSTEPDVLAADAGLDAIVPVEIWKDCRFRRCPSRTRSKPRCVSLPAACRTDGRSPLILTTLQ